MEAHSTTAEETGNRLEIEVLSGELLGYISEIKSSTTVSLGSEKTMPRRTQRIQKATGINVYVILMANMQKIMRSQQSVIT